MTTVEPRYPALSRSAAAPDSYAEWAWDPYRSLEPNPSGPLHARLVVAAYEALADPSAKPLGVQVHASPYFRRVVALGTGDPVFDIEHPAEMAPGRRTARWSHVCQLLSGPVDESTRHKLQVLLKALLLPKVAAELSSCRRLLDVGGDTDRARDYLTWIHASALANPSCESRAQDEDGMMALAVDTRLDVRLRLGLADTLVVKHARRKTPDRDGVDRWRSEASSLFDELDDTSDWTASLAASTHWRAICYSWFLDGDGPRTDAELDEAEAWAERIDPPTPAAAVVARHNMHPLLETRSKVAMWRGDHARAVRYARRLCRLDPADAKVHMNLADLLAGTGRAAEAIDRYQMAAGMGPPYEVLCWHKLALCLQRHGCSGRARWAADLRSAVEPSTARSDTSAAAGTASRTEEANR